MLVLGRGINETIEVDGPAVFQILKIKGNSVKVGIIANGEVKILRGELEKIETTDTEGDSNEKIKT